MWWCSKTDDLYKMERFFAIVGGITFVYIFISVILRVWNFLLAYVIPGLGLRKNLRKYGPWAGEFNYYTSYVLQETSVKTTYNLRINRKRDNLIY